MKITPELVSKIDSLLDHGLVQGLGKPVPGQMCVEAMICYALDLPHADDPQCVSPAIRELKIALNDSNWSSNITRAKGMRNLAILQLGTKDNFDNKEFAKRVVLFTCKDFIPFVFKDEVWFTDELKQGIIDAGDDIVALSAVMNAVHNCAAAHAYHAATNAAYARVAAYAYHAAAYHAATNAAHAAHAAARDSYAGHAAARASYAGRAADDILLYFTKGVEATLVDMNVPGKDFI